jgi:hypothetical protein
MVLCPAKNDHGQKKFSPFLHIAIIAGATKKRTYRFPEMIGRQQQPYTRTRRMSKYQLSLIFKVVLKEPHPFNFDVLKREMLEDPEATLVEVGYLGENVPLDFDLYLRMRQDVIKEVLVEERKSKFETFKDDCSTFISIPISIKNAGKLKLKIIHEPYRRNG